ncbi:MAG: flagellar basal body-associated FliL family protein [Pelagibaca sp.]
MALARAPETDSSESTQKSSKLVLILSVVLGLAGAGLGFFALTNGLVPLGQAGSDQAKTQHASTVAPDVAFVEIPPLIVTLPPGSRNEHLRFTGLIEVPAGYEEEVLFLMPRIQDVLNGYLRALTIEDIEGAGALFRIRLQLFRRIVMVVGLGKANSLLVTEFILN